MEISNREGETTMKTVFLWLIRFYQKYISPCKRPCCRFVPTCSQYAYEAITKYGAIKGGVLALWRLLRCNPFNDGDIFDPVP
jgi:putative membrane protein insertion efficiency factor